MKIIDRLILGAIAVGIWALIAIQITAHAPAYADQPYYYEIAGLDPHIKEIVSGCTVSNHERIRC